MIMCSTRSRGVHVPTFSNDKATSGHNRRNRYLVRRSWPGELMMMTECTSTLKWTSSSFENSMFCFVDIAFSSSRTRSLRSSGTQAKAPRASDGKPGIVTPPVITIRSPCHARRSSTAFSICNRSSFGISPLESNCFPSTKIMRTSYLLFHNGTRIPVYLKCKGLSILTCQDIKFNLNIKVEYIEPPDGKSVRAAKCAAYWGL